MIYASAYTIYKYIWYVLIRYNYKCLIDGFSFWDCASNGREMANKDLCFRSVELVWNNILVPLITQEVRNVWKMSPLYGGDRAPNEARVSSMALHVIFQRSFLSGSSEPTKHHLAGFQGWASPTQKDLSSPKPPPSPTSPEWSEDKLAKILGLPPLGYV